MSHSQKIRDEAKTGEEGEKLTPNSPRPFLRKKSLQRKALQGLNLSVGAPGFEPGTSSSQSRRDTGLRYAPRSAQVTISCLARATHLRAHETRGSDDCCERCSRCSIPQTFRPGPALRRTDR